MKYERKHEFLALQTKVRHITNCQVANAMLAGIGSIGGDKAKLYREEFSIRVDIQRAMAVQERISGNTFPLEGSHNTCETIQHSHVIPFQQKQTKIHPNIEQA